jgi:hypothetical protein
MANRLLLQTLLRFSDDIKSGAAKVQDVITDYFNTTGKSVTDEERSIILKEFQDNAPSNVEEVDFSSDFLFTDKAKSKTPFTDKVREQNPDVELRGDETFGELTEKLNKPRGGTRESVKKEAVEKYGFTPKRFDEIMDSEFDEKLGDDLLKETDQGLGSLYPKGEPGEIFDTANSKRAEMAAFMKAMRAAGIKNEDVINTAKITDVAEGKRAATTLARAAETGADTKIKQEILSELDEQVMDKGPRFFQEEYMGYESMGNLLENITTTVNNGIYDDLIEQGVPEDKVSSIFRYIASVRDNMKYDPKAVLRKIADDIEMEDIKYDTTFWDNYIDEILSRIQKPEPRS